MSIKPTNEFEKFLGMVNLTRFWDGYNLMKLRSFDSRLKRELRKLPNDSYTPEQKFEIEKKTLFRLLSELESEQFSHYVLGKSLNEFAELSIEVISASISRFTSFEGKRKVFMIILRQKSLFERRSIIFKPDEIKTFGQTTQAIKFGLNANGEVFFQPFDFSIFNNVDFRRVKICQNCEVYFWASHLKSKSCSKKCSNFYHQKIFQSDEKKRTRYNEQRRENYKYKKEKQKT